ncbi:MAG: T9SS type A sorting domain-containing protein [Saprospiraceae bacterium]|nr:T9SS type A sorting domain-containing protein [Saprospiraceae bacterium]
MILNHTFIILWLAFGYVLHAQPTVQWQKTFGGTKQEYARDVIVTQDGGYLVIGWTFSNDGDVTGFKGVADYWVLRLNTSGEIIWKKTYGGSHFDWPYDAIQTPDGGFIIVGYSRSDDGDVLGQHGDKDAWIIKINASGEILWQRALGGSGWDEAWSITLTSDGGFAVAGISDSTDGDCLGNQGLAQDYWVVKMNQDGVVEWQKSFGGSNFDRGIFITSTTDAGFLITGEAGSADGDVIDNNGDQDFWVLKLDSEGNIEWQNALGGEGLDVGSGMYEVNDGYLGFGYVGSLNTGDVSFSYGSFDYWIVKLDMNGQLVWEKSYGGSDADWLFTGTIFEDGGLIVSGTSLSNDADVSFSHGYDDIWLVKINNSGDVEWEKSIGGSSSEACFQLQKTPDNGLVLVGFTFSTDGDATGTQNWGYGDLWIVKLSLDSVSTTAQPNTNALKLFPNPAQDAVTISIPGELGELQITLTNTLGVPVAEGQVINGGNFQIGALPSGIYWLSATGESKRGGGLLEVK